MSVSHSLSLPFKQRFKDQKETGTIYVLPSILHFTHPWQFVQRGAGREEEGQTDRQRVGRPGLPALQTGDFHFTPIHFRVDILTLYHPYTTAVISEEKAAAALPPPAACPDGIRPSGAQTADLCSWGPSGTHVSLLALRTRPLAAWYRHQGE